MSEKLCVVMPVYNEQEAIGPVLEKWEHALDVLKIDYSIRPYNDGSKDNSLSVMLGPPRGCHMSMSMTSRMAGMEIRF